MVLLNKAKQHLLTRWLTAQWFGIRDPLDPLGTRWNCCIYIKFNYTIPVYFKID